MTLKSGWFRHGKFIFLENCWYIIYDFDILQSNCLMDWFLVIPFPDTIKLKMTSKSSIRFVISIFDIFKVLTLGEKSKSRFESLKLYLNVLQEKISVFKETRWRTNWTVKQFKPIAI